jgi:hypothetical protein
MVMEVTMAVNVVTFPADIESGEAPRVHIYAQAIFQAHPPQALIVEEAGKFLSNVCTFDGEDLLGESACGFLRAFICFASHKPCGLLWNQTLSVYLLTKICLVDQHDSQDV